MLSDLKTHITEMVNGTAPTGPPPAGAFGFHA
jgi:hypothetical protein